ncbi:MAG: AAA family ATPase [Leptospiraceae bacterium]|nr:AAA family ATPase [Leptospiraceae bacterium]
MISIPGYQILEQLKENSNYVIWKGIDLNKRPVIGKVLKWESITPKEKASLRNEYEILKSLSDKLNIIQVYEFIEREDIYALVLEDFGGKSIRSLLEEKKFTLLEILNIGIASASALAEIHSSGVIHKDINPANLVLNVETGQIKVIDFGISERISLKSLSLNNPEKLDGTIAYISPEQTGRMNRYIDHRSDLYSLGVTLYELFCGKVPFDSDDSLEVIHAHIATYPIDPCIVNPNLPKIISDIIIKLLEKIGESRYQSAIGLKIDLEKCHQMLLKNGNIEEFPLGEKDFSSSFQIPQKLFGRQENIIQLFDAYSNAFEGDRTTILIEGHSGTGKSALVHELFKILKNFKGVKTYYITGKFDQFQKSIPYYAFNKAFNSYISFLLSEQKDFIASKKTEILKALNGMGSVLLEIIPDLELITGPLEEVDSLDATQSQNRLHYLFKNFMLSICNNMNPLVIFIDDMQWADSGSLGLIKILMNDTDIKHMLFIGAYRNNEVSATHPLSILIEDSIAKEAKIEKIDIQNLTLPDIKSLIAETLYKNENEVSEISELVFSKTSGNAFFVNQFLKSLYDKNLIYFDNSNIDINPEWIWNFEKILYEKITDNVVLLMTEKILELSKDSSHCIQIASCLGNKFELRMLSLILNKDLKETFTLLWEAIQKNLLIPIGEYKIILTSNSEKEIPMDFNLEINFAHDRIQQSAYNLLNELQKKEIHHKIGKTFFEKLSIDEHNERIFEIIHHLNYGSDLLETKSEKFELAVLNLKTGRKAKLSSAYEAALSYFENGLELIRSFEATTEIISLRLDFYSDACETCWLLSNPEKMHQMANIVLTLSSSPLQKIRVYKVLITYNVSTGNGEGALKKALEILNELGLKMEIYPSQLAIIRELIKTKLTLAGKSYASLANLPKLKNPTSLAIMEILSVTSSPAYTTSPNLLPILVFKQVAITAKQGLTNSSAFAYTSLALIYCGVLNDIDNGYEFGKLGLLLLDKVLAPEFKPKTILVFNGFVRFWKEHLHNTLTPLLEAHKIGLEVGDLEFAGISCYTYTLQSFHCGKEITNLLREMEIYDRVLNNINQSDRLPYHKIFYQMVENFSGKQENPEILKGAIYDPEISIPVHLQRKDRTAIFTVNLCKGILQFHFGDANIALEALITAEKDLDTVIASPNVPVMVFYLALAYVRYAKNNSIKNNFLIIKKINQNKKRLKFWSKYCPENYLHKFYLVEAELASLLKKEKEAKQFYDLAILNARKNEYLQEEALSWELAGNFFSNSNEILAEVYLQKAYTCYLKWGSFAKIKSLEQKFPNYIRNLKNSQMYRETHITKTQSTRKSTILATTSTNRLDILDLNSILKASQTISSEINLSILVSSLMKLMAENAGAEKGYLILEDDGELWLEAAYGMANKEFVRIRLSEYENIASSIVNYVINSKSSAVFDNAIEQSAHTDEYIKRQKPKSILCMPLLNRGAMSGILYLENNLITGAFTEQSLNLLNLLSSQAAISIQNARFYEHLKKVNQAYERFVPREFLQLLDKKSILDVELGQFIERQMTVLFCDIRDFTTLSEEMSPEENFKFINSFLRRMEPAISKNKGFIDKYIGDAIMALFSDRADDALLAAIEMRANLSAYNLHSEKSNYHQIRIGIGINTGDLMLGTIGGSSRMDGTVISDSVNLAARIESLTKTFHTPILVSEYLVGRLQNKNQFYLREIDRVKVKGKEKSVTIFECFNCDKLEIIDKKLNSMENYNQGLNAFKEGNFSEAREFFNRCQKQCPEDPIPVIYINRCNKLLSSKKGERNNENYLYEDIVNNKKVLLVDDNTAILEFMSKMFSKKQYEIVLAETEKNALFKYESFLPDVVLVDLHLAEGSGYSILQSIRRIADRYNKNPVLILTTAEESVEPETAIKMGADFFFRKPIAFDELFDKLKNAKIG